MNNLLNMKIVNNKPDMSILSSKEVVDEETHEENPNFIYEEDEPNIKEVMSEVSQPEKKQLLNVVKKPPIVKEAIFDDKPKKKKWSEEKKKKQQKTKEPEMTQEEIDSYAPEEGYKEESDDEGVEPIIPESNDVGGLDVKEPEPAPSEPVVKKRKPKKPMTEEHKRKVQEGLKKARETRKRNAELRRQKGIKTKTELKKEKKQLEMKLLEQEHAELQKQKKLLKPEPTPSEPEPKPEPEPTPSEPEPVKEKPVRDYITREDLEQAQLNTLATYEMMRKKRKEEKRKQQAIQQYEDNLKETIKNINNQPQMGWLKGAKKYGRYL